MSDRIVERRQSRRRDQVSEHGVIAARVQPGLHARVINISSGGVLLETTHRLLPGAAVEVHLETSSRRTAVRGRVLRCAVERLRPAWICYRGAIGFDRPLVWLPGSDGYAVPEGDPRSRRLERGEATPRL